MTEIEELLEACAKSLKEWHKPSLERPEHHQAKPWQKLMDERKVSGTGRS